MRRLTWRNRVTPGGQYKSITGVTVTASDCYGAKAPSGMMEANMATLARGASTSAT